MGLVVRNFCLFVVVVVVEGKLWSWVVENSEQFSASWRSTNREVICVFVVIVVVVVKSARAGGENSYVCLFVSAVTPPNCFFFTLRLVGFVFFLLVLVLGLLLLFFVSWRSVERERQFLDSVFPSVQEEGRGRKLFSWADFVSCSIIHLWRCAAAWGSLDMVMGSTESRLPGWGPRRERRTK